MCNFSDLFLQVNLLKTQIFLTSNFVDSLGYSSIYNHIILTFQSLSFRSSCLSYNLRSASSLSNCKEDLHRSIALILIQCWASGNPTARADEIRFIPVLSMILVLEVFSVAFSVHLLMLFFFLRTVRSSFGFQSRSVFLALIIALSPAPNVSLKNS